MSTIDHLLRRLRGRDGLAEFEERVLHDSFSPPRAVAARQTLAREGEKLIVSTLLVSGFVARYKDGSDGRRQIIALHVPGDFIDLPSFLLKDLEHNIGALTPVTIATVPHERLREISERWPHLTRMLWFLTLLDGAIYRERIVTLARRSAQGRLAHMFRELQLRLQRVGLADDTGYELPITQGDIGDVTGLTPVHVNRTLRMLREAGTIDLRGGRVEVRDIGQLERAADFDPTYLYLDRERL